MCAQDVRVGWYGVTVIIARARTHARTCVQLFGQPPWAFVPPSLLPLRSPLRGVYYTLQDDEYRALHQHPRYSKFVPRWRDADGREYAPSARGDDMLNVRLPIAARRRRRELQPQQPRLDFPPPYTQQTLTDLQTGLRHTIRVEASPNLGRNATQRTGTVRVTPL